MPLPVFRRRLDDLAGRFRVTDLLSVPVRNFSLGERMKMELIAALLHRPPHPLAKADTGLGRAHDPFHGDPPLKPSINRSMALVYPTLSFSHRSPPHPYGCTQTLLVT